MKPFFICASLVLSLSALAGTHKTILICEGQNRKAQVTIESWNNSPSDYGVSLGGAIEADGRMRTVYASKNKMTASAESDFEFSTSASLIDKDAKRVLFDYNEKDQTAILFVKQYSGYARADVLYRTSVSLECRSAE